ncbi:hypothetical protein [Lewinella sp. LCG006]|uniref:hypothetical protein n=1 Tax=Lewinella sp. LCG006 TaxID=3231911 RepID=UPI003460D361
MNMKEEILNLIRKGDLEKAINMMVDYSTTANFGNITYEIYLLQSRYSRNEIQYLKETTSKEDYDSSLNRITIGLIEIVDKMFVSTSEFITNEAALPYTLYYSTDRRNVSSFQVIFDKESRKVVIDNTRSKSEYKGKYYLYSNHTCITVENNTNYFINVIFYSGTFFPNDDHEISLGIVNLIGIDGVACSSSAVLRKGTPKENENRDTVLIEHFILHRPVLGIHNSLKGVFNERELRNRIDSENVIGTFAGIYKAIIVSNRRKALIPFALEITKTGILISHREPNELSNLEGIVHVIDKNTITINVYLNHRDEKVFAEFRVYLNTSKGTYRKYKFYSGTYSSISYRGKEPRAGRCLMIKLKSKYIDEISTTPIEIGSQEFNEMTAKYPKLIDYLSGKYDDYIEDFQSAVNTQTE